VLNITTTSVNKYVPPMLLNHITTPHVVILSAVLASCAVPTVLGPVELLEKDESGTIRPFHFHGARWSDGRLVSSSSAVGVVICLKRSNCSCVICSIKHDIPLTAVTETHNVNYFVVSQVQQWASVVRHSGFTLVLKPAFSSPNWSITGESARHSFRV